MSLIITAPKTYARRFRHALQQQKVPCRCVSMIETLVTPHTEGMKLLAEHLSEFDYLMFCSRHAIESFAQSGIIVPLSVECLAIGSDNYLLKRRLGIEPSFISAEPSPMGIVSHLSRIPDIAHRKIAVLAPRMEVQPQPDTVPQFLRSLRGLDIAVNEIEAYTTCATPLVRRARLLRLLPSDENCWIAFTSGAEVTAFVQSIQQCYGRDVMFAQSFKVACFGPYTAAHARSLGLTVHLVSPDFGSFTGFAKALADLHVF